MNENPFQISQGYEVLPPKSGKAYPVPCDEWSLLKSKIEDLSEKNELYNDASWALFGVTLSTLVSVLVGSFSQTALIIAWSVIVVTLICALLCLHFASRMRRVRKTQASEVLTQMEIIERRYQDEPIDAEE
jgi:uncharacterized membrane protein